MPICILREKLLTTIRTGYDILCGLLLACRGGVDYASQKALPYCAETCERKLLGFREFYVNHHPEKVTPKVYTSNKKDTHLLTNVIKLGVIAKPIRRLVVAISFRLGDSNSSLAPQRRAKRNRRRRLLARRRALARNDMLLNLMTLTFWRESFLTFRPKI